MATHDRPLDRPDETFEQFGLISASRPAFPATAMPGSNAIATEGVVLSKGFAGASA
jgi:hypothetical protein